MHLSKGLFLGGLLVNIQIPLHDNIPDQNITAGGIYFKKLGGLLQDKKWKKNK